MKWISVEDELPEYGKRVLTVCQLPARMDREIKIQERINTEGTALTGKLLERLNDFSGFYDQTFYWMPLPEPPTVEKN